MSISPYKKPPDTRKHEWTCKRSRGEKGHDGRLPSRERVVARLSVIVEYYRHEFWHRIHSPSGPHGGGKRLVAQKNADLHASPTHHAGFFIQCDALRSTWLPHLSERSTVVQRNAGKSNVRLDYSTIRDPSQAVAASTPMNRGMHSRR